jgi:hypothetical protein
MMVFSFGFSRDCWGASYCQNQLSLSVSLYASKTVFEHAYCRMEESENNNKRGIGFGYQIILDTCPQHQIFPGANTPKCQ